MSEDILHVNKDELVDTLSKMQKNNILMNESIKHYREIIEFLEEKMKTDGISKTQTKILNALLDIKKHVMSEKESSTIELSHSAPDIKNKALSGGTKNIFITQTQRKKAFSKRKPSNVKRSKTKRSKTKRSKTKRSKRKHARSSFNKI